MKKFISAYFLMTFVLVNSPVIAPDKVKEPDTVYYLVPFNQYVEYIKEKYKGHKFSCKRIKELKKQRLNEIRKNRQQNIYAY